MDQKCTDDIAISVYPDQTADWSCTVWSDLAIQYLDFYGKTYIKTEKYKICKILMSVKVLVTNIRNVFLYLAEDSDRL